MKSKPDKIFLPGGFDQYAFLGKHFNIADAKILILGYGAEPVADRMMIAGAASVDIVVVSGELLLQSRMNLKSQKVTVKYMDYDQMSYDAASFDLVYAQGSVAFKTRNLIATQVFRILTPKGFFCLGETVSLREDPPRFIKDIWEASGMAVLTREALLEYYKERGFVIDTIKNLSHSLQQFYLDSREELDSRLKFMSAEEKKELKKLIPKLNHEINAYLKQGGNKYMGFIAHLFHK